MKIRNLNDVLAQELRELLGAECCVYHGMKKLCKRVSDPELLHALRERRNEAQMQSDRLRAILADLDVKPKPIDSHAMEGIFQDINQALKSISGHLADIYILSAALKILNFEVNMYETLLPAVHELGLEEAHIAGQLEESLNAEKTALCAMQRLGQRLLKEGSSSEETTHQAGADTDIEPGHDEYYEDVHQPHEYDYDDTDDEIPEEGALPEERMPTPARDDG